jgi:hypothetical protein
MHSEPAVLENSQQIVSESVPAKKQTTQNMFSKKLKSQLASS